MKSIITKYLGPGNVRGSRMKATAAGGCSKTVPYDDALTQDGNHAAAAQALATQLGWRGTWVRGYLEDATVFVLLTGDEAFHV